MECRQWFSASDLQFGWRIVLGNEKAGSGGSVTRGEAVTTVTFDAIGNASLDRGQRGAPGDLIFSCFVSFARSRETNALP